MIRLQFRKIRPLIEEQVEPIKVVKKRRKKKRRYVRKEIDLSPQIKPEIKEKKEPIIYIQTYIKVGRKLLETDEKIFAYKHVDYDKEGWTDADKFHPVDFDLLYLKLEGVTGAIRGWCSGNAWDGLKYNGEKVLKWKFVKDG